MCILKSSSRIENEETLNIALEIIFDAMIYCESSLSLSQVLITAMQKILKQAHIDTIKIYWDACVENLKLRQNVSESVLLMSSIVNKVLFIKRMTFSRFLNDKSSLHSFIDLYTDYLYDLFDHQEPENAQDKEAIVEERKLDPMFVLNSNLKLLEGMIQHCSDEEMRDQMLRIFDNLIAKVESQEDKELVIKYRTRFEHQSSLFDQQNENLSVFRSIVDKYSST